MSTLEFEPGSWDKAAVAFEEESQSFVNKAQAAINAMDVGAMGATSAAGTVADLAFSVVFPVAFQALLETAQGIDAGLRATATGMRETGDAYRGIELRNQQASSTIVGSD